MKLVFITTAFCIAVCCCLVAQNARKDTPPKKPDTFKQQPASTTPPKPENEKDVIKKSDILVAILSSSVLTTLLTVISDIITKRRIEKGIGADTKKQDKRIKAVEDIYAESLKLRDYDGTPMTLQPLLDQIYFIRNYYIVNALYVERPLKEIIEELLDYFSNVSTDYTIRNVREEAKHLDKIVKYFNK